MPQESMDLPMLMSLIAIIFTSAYWCFTKITQANAQIAALKARKQLAEATLRKYEREERKEA